MAPVVDWLFEGLKSYFCAKIWRADRNRLVPQVRLRESEAYLPRQVADVCLHGQRLAQAEEVVRLIVQPDEGSRQSADSAVQADRVLALLLQLQQQVDCSVLGVLAALGVLLHLQRLEVAQLVQTQDRQLPQLTVVDLSLFEKQFAPDDLVARDRVSRKFDSGDIERLAFVDVDVEVDQFLRVINPGNRVPDHVDIAQRTIRFAKLIEALAELSGVEPVTVFLSELRS